METTVPVGAVPENYQEVLYWKITDDKQALWLIQGFGVLLMILFGGLFGAFALAVGAFPMEFEMDLVFSLGLLFGLVAMIVLHELVHGLTMTLFGAHPQYGFMPAQLMFYATAPGHAFTRRNYLYVALAPLVVLSLLSLVAILLVSGSAWVLFFITFATVNAAGAVGDLYITLKVLRYPAHAFIMDEKDGVRVFLPAQ
ncbi:MAG TPA: DUF3267 domain-containing protein [Anaerolineaceae bacterium]|nr:DUF3267 domain-containing protein [Anaerolineaceae bacterium]HPN50192.1 DUF3267 domain-containing protein [Anaerolineaceae bacterium]